MGIVYTCCNVTVLKKGYLSVSTVALVEIIWSQKTKNFYKIYNICWRLYQQYQ